MDLLADLVAAIGPDHVLVDPGVRASYERDWTGRFRGDALAVVRPGSTDEVAAVVRACGAAGAAVVPQGGNTGLVGGGVPRPSSHRASAPGQVTTPASGRVPAPTPDPPPPTGRAGAAPIPGTAPVPGPGPGRPPGTERAQVVLSTGRLDEVGEVDVEARQLLVGAGVTLERAQAAALAAGYEVGIDLASRGTATVGGMVATDAGGIHVVRNGDMRARVAGVEAVLADGTVVRRLAGLLKDNAGYDLTGLLVGSEGTLGVVTRVLLSLVPRPVERVTVAFGAAGLAEAVAAVGRLAGRLPGLEAAEGCFADGLDLVERALGVRPPLPGRPPVTVVVEVGAWSAAAAGVLLDEVAEALLSCPEVITTAVATDEGTRARLWEARERHTEAVATLGVPHKLDVAVPLGRLAAFERDVRARVGEVAPGARCVLWGHVGDGNLHVNVVGPDPGDETVDGAVLTCAAAHGGTVSAEHGIGIAKVPWLGLTRSPEEVAAMRAIKAALDPGQVLNPGALFAPP